MTTDNEVTMAYRCKEIEGELSRIKHRMLACGRLPDHEFRTLSARRAELCSERSGIDALFGRLKAQRRMVAEQEAAAKPKMTDRISLLLRGILQLRDIYRDQAKDPTRTAAVRHMAELFQTQLTKLMEQNPQ